MNDPWVQTFTGKHFRFLNPDESEIDIIDIAHHLSQQCRFVGACKQPYTVGEHCIRVSWLLPDELKLAGLLHDAAETYTGDIPKPYKVMFRDLEALENIIVAVIYKKFGVDWYRYREIKWADDVMLATEARDLMPHHLEGWPMVEPQEGRIVPIPQIEVKRLFLEEFERLI